MSFWENMALRWGNMMDLFTKHFSYLYESKDSKYYNLNTTSCNTTVYEIVKSCEIKPRITLKRIKFSKILKALKSCNFLNNMISKFNVFWDRIEDDDCNNKHNSILVLLY